MPKVIIVHGIEGSKTEHKWFSWLKKELEKNKYEAWCESMPNSYNPDQKIWTKIILDQITPNTILVGHSLGSAAILRALEKWEGEKIKALFCIAGFARNLDKTVFKERLAPFFKEPFDFQKIKNNVERIYVWSSDDDPYVSLQESNFLVKKLDGIPKIFHARDHLGTWDEKGEFPELFNNILTL